MGKMIEQIWIVKTS